MTDAEIEAVAQAICGDDCGDWEDAGSLTRDQYRRDARVAIAALDKARGDDASPLMAFAAYAQQRADELAATCEESRHDQVRAIKRIEWLKVSQAALDRCGVEPGYIRRQLTEAALKRAATEADKRGWGATAIDRRHCSDHAQGAQDAADEIAAAIRALLPAPPTTEGA